MDIPVYIGYDKRVPIAYDVCKYSISKHSSEALVSPIVLSHLRESGTYTRPDDPLSSTEFTFSRFLVPHLCDYKGWAVFCDCDFLWLTNIQKLFEYVDDQYAVMVVKHNYTPQQTSKMDNKAQYQYPRKNWSSLVLWNCSHPSNKCVTPQLVNTESGQYLHRFKWLDDHEIGEISHEWNWLTDWYHEPEDGKPKVLHFTLGGPWLNNYRDTKYADVWRQYLSEYNESCDYR
jgi:lipopolysaccharide biosynthesis glycosyltransferase